MSEPNSNVNGTTDGEALVEGMRAALLRYAAAHNGGNEILAQTYRELAPAEVTAAFDRMTDKALGIKRKEIPTLVITGDTSITVVSTYQGRKFDARTLSDLFQLVEWEMTICIHPGGPGENSFLVVPIPDDDGDSGIELVREDDDWTIEVHRRGDARIAIADVAKLAGTLNHAVYLANALNKLEMDAN